MSATERVRELLDERRVEYRFNEITKVFEWHFEGTDGDGSAHATEVQGGINIIACSLTPEQAIAATLGDAPSLPYWWTHDGALHVELPKLPDSISVRLPDQRDREVGSARTWQYTLGTGTCHDEGDPSDFCCSECGVRMFTNTSDTYTMIASDGCTIVKHPNYCPNCGAKVVEPTTNDADAEVDGG